MFRLRPVRGIREGHQPDQEDLSRRHLFDRGGPRHVGILRGLSEAGFDPMKMPIASLTTSEAEVAEMHREAAEGHITAAPFFETSSSSAARRFVDNFKNKYGPDAPVTAAAEAAYFQLHLAMRALARCGRTIRTGC